ncbi:MAG: FAD:protein FMN transferase, partial [Bacteroidales bacterium]|nr:FAD:protein FMN transferase [Bacteroidales bacterium]
MIFAFKKYPGHRFFLTRLGFFFICLLFRPAFTQVSDSGPDAFRQAKDLNRPVLLIFSGSDWCIPCIRFRKEILSDSAFVRFADENLILLKADFPQKKKLPPEMVARNESLAARYNPGGLFPHLILLNSDGDSISILSYSNQTPAEFIRQIEPFIPAGKGMKEFSANALLMGCGFTFTIVDSAGSDRGWDLIRESISEVKRIECLISEWIDTTEVSRLNANSGIEPVKVSPELFDLISRSIKISEITQGAFDITFGGVGKLWNFDRKNPVMPDSSAVKQALGSVGYRFIVLMDSSKVFLSKPGMQIGFGGIGQGYAAEKVKERLIAKGITSGVVNASGDVLAWGNRPDGSPWKIGIGDPHDPSKVLLWLPVNNGTVSTSGDYENYFEINGERYSHIIDPRTGYPAKGIQSVT